MSRAFRKYVTSENYLVDREAIRLILRSQNVCWGHCHALITVNHHFKWIDMVADTLTVVLFTGHSVAGGSQMGDSGHYSIGHYDPSNVVINPLKKKLYLNEDGELKLYPCRLSHQFV